MALVAMKIFRVFIHSSIVCFAIITTGYSQSIKVPPTVYVIELKLFRPADPEGRQV